MTPFQQIALLLLVVWFLLVVVRFRRSMAVLIGGLVVVGLFTLAALLHGDVSLQTLGLGASFDWFPVMVIALIWLGLMLVYSPLADRLASRWFAQPPSLGAFRALKRSWINLIAGIAAAWLLGGFLEELIARGILLQSINAAASPWLAAPLAAGIAIAISAAGAGLMHLYQGPRAALIIAQLSILFGVLFVLTGYNLWAVIVCHGLYDTIAFIHFATQKSKWSKGEGDT